MKSTAILQLEALALEDAQRRFPAAARMGALAPRRYTDKTANGLTRAILDYLKLEGWQAERISCSGRPIDGTKRFTDVLGNTRQIGSVRWIPGTTTPGSADISSTIKGRSVKIEVKIGRDRQSEAQKQYQQVIAGAGGIYLLVRSFDEFLEWYNGFI